MLIEENIDLRLLEGSTEYSVLIFLILGVYVTKQNLLLSFQTYSAKRTMITCVFVLYVYLSFIVPPGYVTNMEMIKA